MPNLLKSFAQLWSTDRGLTVLVVLLVITIFVLPPLVQGGSPGLELLFDILVSLVLLTGLTAITRTRGVLIGGSVLVLVAVAGKWMSRITPEPGLLQFNIVMSVVSTLMLAGLVVFQVFREGPISVHRILGGVGVYLLLGLAWSFAYHLIDVVNPGAFTISSGSTPRLHAGFDYLYFSFVTLTTVGYGDITAMAPAARSAAMLEALTGQLYPAILIARLVSMELVSRSS